MRQFNRIQYRNTFAVFVRVGLFVDRAVDVKTVQAIAYGVDYISSIMHSGDNKTYLLYLQALYRKPISELWSVTCHRLIRSHQHMHMRPP